MFVTWKPERKFHVNKIIMIPYICMLSNPLSHLILNPNGNSVSTLERLLDTISFSIVLPLSSLSQHAALRSLLSCALDIGLHIMLLDAVLSKGSCHRRQKSNVRVLLFREDIRDPQTIFYPNQNSAPQPQPRQGHCESIKFC